MANPTKDEIRAMAERAYPTDDKMSDATFKRVLFHRLAFRTGAEWALDPDAWGAPEGGNDGG